MSAVANELEKSTISSTVTSISINARIDYIMRFSKQAVLVIDPDSNIYSLVGSQFLGSLPDGHNAALISISSKFNDIQIRCRLVEQLFSEVLFDPEESLAVTVLKLAKSQKQVISIVVENVQHLSLQLMHEFCQLVELAGKSGRNVNLLLLGEDKAGKLIADNKAVFYRKLSIISASSGKLIPLDSPIINGKRNKKLLTPLRKLLLIVAIFIVVSFSVLVYLYQSNSLSFSTLILKESQINPSNSTFVIEDKMVTVTEKIIKTPLESLSLPATTTEIYLALSTTHQLDSKIVEARPEEVVHSLVVNEVIPQPDDVEDIFASTIILASVTDAVSNSLSDVYFLKAKQGYVVQLIGFSKIEAHNSFMNKYKNLGFVSYNRLLNDKKIIMITTRVYPLKSDAQAAISLLPTALQGRKPWIKSVEMINLEITEYQKIQ